MTSFPYKIDKEFKSHPLLQILVTRKLSRNAVYNRSLVDELTRQAKNLQGRTGSKIRTFITSEYALLNYQSYQYDKKNPFKLPKLPLPYVAFYANKKLIYWTNKPGDYETIAPTVAVNGIEGELLHALETAAQRKTWKHWLTSKFDGKTKAFGALLALVVLLYFYGGPALAFIKFLKTSVGVTIPTWVSSQTGLWMVWARKVMKLPLDKIKFVLQSLAGVVYTRYYKCALTFARARDLVKKHGTWEKYYKSHWFGTTPEINENCFTFVKGIDVFLHTRPKLINGSKTSIK